MGMIRKMTSMGTLGLVDFRSDKERTAAYAKATKREAKRQTRLMEQAMSAPPAPPAMPARWYPDPDGAPCLRYWDGQRWTKDTAPLPQ